MSTDQETPGTEDPASQSAGVWPPPPTDPAYIAAMRTGLRPDVPYSPANMLYKCVIGLLVIGIPFTFCEIFLTLMRTPSATALEGKISSVDLIFTMAAWICFFRWTYISYRNLHAFNVEGLKHSAGWAVGCFFVPIINLYKPYLVFVEMWKASNPQRSSSTPQAWQAQGTPFVVAGWWSIYLFSWVIGIISMIFLTVQIFKNPGATSMFGITIINDIIGVLSAIASIMVVKQIHERQEAKYAAMTRQE